MAITKSKTGVGIMSSYQTLLEQIRLAKIHLDNLKQKGRAFAYRDYKKYYDKLHKEKKDYENFLQHAKEKGDE